MKIFCCLIVLLLFGTNSGYANELSINSSDKEDKTSKVETEEKSPIAPKNDVLNLDHKQADILVDEDLSISRQESKDFVQLLPNKDLELEKDKNTLLQEEKDTEVFNLENEKNSQKGELDNNIESNEDLLPKIQQDLSIVDKPDEDNKENEIPEKLDNSHDSDGDKIEDLDKENTETFKFPQWEDLFKDEIATWKYKEIPNTAIYGKLGENNNNHLPRAVYLQDYNKQIYYCIIKNDLSGLRAIINKLEDIGMSTDDVLALKPDSVHALLGFAMKTNKRNIVDFFLHKGAVFNADSNDELLSAAIQYGYFDLADSIIKIRNFSFKKINNDPNSDMYKWAIEVKHHRS